MSRRTFQVVLILGLFAVAAAFAPSASAPIDFARNANARIKLAKDVLDRLDTMRDQARVGPTDLRYSLWWRRLLDAERDLPDNKNGYIAACKNYLERMKMQESNAELLNKHGDLSLIELDEFRYRRLEAESWLQAAEFWQTQDRNQ